MEKLMALFLSCHLAFSPTVKHSQKFNIMASSGDTKNIPGYFIRANFEDVGMVYYDTTNKTFKPIHDWARRLKRDDPEHWKTISEDGIHYEQIFRVETEGFKQHSNQSGGVDIIQQNWGCEWDEETEMTDGFLKYGSNGEDFLTFDPETDTWIAANPQAEITKKDWDGDAARNLLWKNLLTKSCPSWLKKYFFFTNRLLEKRDRPSVSLLQKSSSSPVSCFATGFYPNKAVLFWRKDGDDLHDNVEEGQILPNPDGTFQKSADLDLSSVRLEDWGKYECVFQLDGLKDDIITKLDQSGIRTNKKKTVNGNHQEKSSITIIIIVVAVVVLLAVIGFVVYKKRRGERLSGCCCPGFSTEVK
ncbi:major histocompatibility complex class I-related gene protein-like [Echeneis naucrates]|uniref:major histocompatibility complex class I-related gene protein-like n=1 Tax=Echeneis naucrates TaxID=173247 RepID=UPI001113C4BF|nr:major histocompatibility complex class I-related gene protein-like [Echeneis naucrates]